MPEAVQDDQTKRTWDIFDDGAGKVKLNTDTVEGGVTKQEVTDESVRGLLNAILKELKIMNIHLSILTDNTIKKTEVE